MLANNHGMGESKPLSGPFTDLLGGEEGLEDASSDRIGNPATVVTDLDANTVLGGEGADRDLARGFPQFSLEDSLISIYQEAQNGMTAHPVKNARQHQSR